MRWILGVILVAIAAVFFMKKPESKPIEETFVGEQIEPLQNAQSFEEEYLKGVDEAKRRLEEDVDRAAGGGG